MKELFTQVREALAAAEANVAADSVVEANRKMLLDRSNLGIEKYGTTLEASGLSLAQFHDHALEEALDLANYLQAAKIVSAEMQNVILMLLSDPNSQANRQAALDVLSKIGTPLVTQKIHGTEYALQIPIILADAIHPAYVAHLWWMWGQLSTEMQSRDRFFSGSDLDKAAEIVRLLREVGFGAFLNDDSGRYHPDGIRKG